MTAASPRRRERAAVVSLATVAMLLLPIGAIAAPEETVGSAGGARSEDRPPAHAASPAPDDRPPEHAASPAPEERPPAHAQAHRGSVAGPSGPGAAGPGRGTAPGRAHDPPPASGPGSELDTDVVAEEARPLPERAPAGADGPLLAAPATSLLLVALAPLPTSVSGSSFAASGGPIAAPDGSSEAAASPAGDTADAGRIAARGPRRGVPLRAPVIARRVVVPVALLVAGLTYLLAQGRIDRRGQLLLAPETAGTEHDDDVFPL